MIFNAGNMTFCEWCDDLRHDFIDEHGDVFYCAKGQKIDSSECEPWATYQVARRAAHDVGKTLDNIKTSDDLDDYYRRERLVERVADALADYFTSIWDDDLTYEVGMPGRLAMHETLDRRACAQARARSEQ